MSEPRRVAVGPLATNCYLWPVGDGGALVIDPGADALRIRRALATGGLALRALALTHGHPDHLAAAGELQREAKVPCYLDPADTFLVEHFRRDWDAEFGPVPTEWPVLTPYPARLVFPQLTLEVRPMPGHSPGGVLLYSAADACAAAGDSIFLGSIGCTDISGGDEATLLDSIAAQVLTLPPETRLLPGHGPATTVARELSSNPFLV